MPTKSHSAPPVDCTPTWRSLVDIYAQAYANGSTAAQIELHRCADAADKCNRVMALVKERLERNEQSVDIESLLYALQMN